MQKSKLQFKIQNFLHISQLGFTILEMAVIIAIVGIISATVVFSDKNSSRKRELTLEAQKLAQDLRKAQNMALSSRVSSECGSKVVPYGVYFNWYTNDRYFLIADCNQDKDYDGASDKIISTVSLAKNITINRLYAGGSRTRLDVFFVPPVPMVAVNANDANPPLAEARICYSGLTTCKNVQINGKGAINVQ